MKNFVCILEKAESPSRLRYAAYDYATRQPGPKEASEVMVYDRRYSCHEFLD